ncbi:MAG: hypothetical protein WHX93_05830 [bacterium]
MENPRDSVFLAPSSMNCFIIEAGSLDEKELGACAALKRYAPILAGEPVGFFQRQRTGR